jgi:hypothetical protein
MNRSNAAVAASLAAILAATLLAPRSAAAHDDGRRPVPSFAVTLPPAPPPWVAVVLPPPPGHRALPSPSVYYRWLDANRAAYLARWGWNPWRVARYEAWYGDYRTGLDARWTAGRRLAWAPDHRDERGRGHRDR